METNKVDILKGPSKKEAAEIYRAGSKKDVCFEIYYGFKRIAFVDALEIMSVQETSVKMLASMPNGFFLYSEGEDPRSDGEKLQRIQVHIFYTTNTGRGYIEKVTKNESECSHIEKETKEPRVCPRCKGSTFDPFYYQDYCHRCGGIGKVYGPESNFQPPSFAD